MKRPILLTNRFRHIVVLSTIAVGMLLFMTGCSLLNMLSSTGTEEPGAEPTEERVVVPTFTPTIETVQEVVIEPTATTVQVVEVEAPVEAVVEEATDTPVPEEPTPEPVATDTPVPSARLIVIGQANVRSGPGTNYGVVGAVTPDQAFDLTGKSPDGQWWQFCCVNGQEGWIFGQLARVENAGAVAVAQNIPPTPIPVQPTPIPVQPTNTPVPAAPPPTQAPAPVVNDPCAGIGGDGCKFKVNGGPAFTQNGGGELKLTLAFVHSGRGDEAQGSYFVVLMKDGVKLPISDSVRSIGATRNGPHGSYNYEYKLNLQELPGNNIAGGYVIWVLDGNGERDSQDFGFSVPGGQGEVWIKFAQNN